MGGLHSSSDGDRAICVVCRKLGSGLNTVWIRGVNGGASAHSVSEFGYLFLCLCFQMPLLGLARSPPGLSVSAPRELPCIPCYFPSSPSMNRQSPVVNSVNILKKIAGNFWLHCYFQFCNVNLILPTQQCFFTAETGIEEGFVLCVFLFVCFFFFLFTESQGIIAESLNNSNSCGSRRPEVRPVVQQEITSAIRPTLE